MSRNEKSEKLVKLQQITAGALEQCHSPKLRAEMIADHGTPTYSPAAWIKHRMHRSESGQPASYIRERKTQGHIRANRKITKRG